MKKNVFPNYSLIPTTRDPCLDLIFNLLKNQKEFRVLRIRLLFYNLLTKQIVPDFRLERIVYKSHKMLDAGFTERHAVRLYSKLFAFGEPWLEESKRHQDNLA